MNEPAIRPVACWYCGAQMHYAGQREHEPEVRINVEAADAEAVMYMHTRCWNEWQRRRGVADILAEYSRTDGRREWVSVSTWIRPGEVVALIDDPRPNARGNAPDTARTETTEA